MQIIISLLLIQEGQLPVNKVTSKSMYSQPSL